MNWSYLGWVRAVAVARVEQARIAAAGGEGIDERVAQRPRGELLPAHLQIARVAGAVAAVIRLQVQPIRPRRCAAGADVAAQRHASKNLRLPQPVVRIHARRAERIGVPRDRVWIRAGDEVDVGTHVVDVRGIDVQQLVGEVVAGVGGVEPRLGETIRVFDIRLLLVADLDRDQVGIVRVFGRVQRRCRAAGMVHPLAPLLTRRKHARVRLAVTPHHRIHIRGSEIVVVERILERVGIQTPDLQPAIDQQLVPFIERGNLGSRAGGATAPTKPMAR